MKPYDIQFGHECKKYSVGTPHDAIAENLKKVYEKDSKMMIDESLSVILSERSCDDEQVCGTQNTSAGSALS